LTFKNIIIGCCTVLFYRIGNLDHRPHSSNQSLKRKSVSNMLTSVALRHFSRQCCYSRSVITTTTAISRPPLIRLQQHLPFHPPNQSPLYLSPRQQRRSMAGHNKWSKIRHKKGAKDSKRAVVLGKASRSITAASKDCNGDQSNLRLQAAIAHAKAVQLPKDRIEEAIEKGTVAYRNKKGEGDDLVNLRFDAMMRLETAQVACIITALSDNRNRTTQHVRHLVSKAGGELLPTDNLNYLFEQVGVILVEQQDDAAAPDQDFEELLMECALEAGAINVEELSDEEEQSDNESGATADNGGSNRAFVVTTEERDLWQVVQALQEAGYGVSQFEHRYVLQDEHGGVGLSTKDWEELDDFLEKLEDNEDVNNVYHNAT